MDRDRGSYTRLRWWYPERNDQRTFITPTTSEKGGGRAHIGKGSSRGKENEGIESGMGIGVTLRRDYIAF